MFRKKHIKDIYKYKTQNTQNKLGGFHSCHNIFSAVHCTAVYLHYTQCTPLSYMDLNAQSKMKGALALLTNVGLFGTLILFGDSQSFQKRALDGAARTHFQNTLLRVSDIQDTF